MSSFVGKKPVRVTIDERPDEWIDIKPKFSIQDRAAFQDSVLKAEFNREGDENQAHISMAAGQLTFRMLELAVVGWQLKDDEGGHVPFKREMIGALDQDDPLVDKALAEIAERNPTLAGKSATPGSES